MGGHEDDPPFAGAGDNGVTRLIIPRRESRSIAELAGVAVAVAVAKGADSLAYQNRLIDGCRPMMSMPAWYLGSPLAENSGTITHTSLVSRPRRLVRHSDRHAHGRELARLIAKTKSCWKNSRSPVAEKNMFV